MSSPEGHTATEYVQVLETSNYELIPVIKSILDGAQIEYVVEGEDLINLFPSDMLGRLYKPAAEVKFRVPADRAEEARAILSPADPG